MEPRSAICVIVDRLHAGMIGAYGNSWIRTPELDRLASESFLFDQAVICSPRLEALYDGLWTGESGIAHAPDPQRSVPRQISELGVETVLITDDPVVAKHRLARGFTEIVVVEQPGVRGIADTVEETQLARIFAAASAWLSDVRSPSLLWLHVHGLSAAWDAPFDYRAQYCTEEDPLPSDSVEVPSLLLGRDYDPDTLLDIVHRYAGQISALDQCVGLLVDQLRAAPSASQTLFSLLSARGFPLGEHGRVGAYDEALYAELIQVPWMLRLPDGQGALTRSSALTPSLDLAPTLRDWWQMEPAHQNRDGKSVLPLVRGEEVSSRQRIYFRAGEQERGLRTPAWYARWQVGTGKPLELYAKPSDRWEVNQVAARCADVATVLFDELTQLEQSAQVESLPPAEEILLTEMD